MAIFRKRSLGPKDDDLARWAGEGGSAPIETGVVRKPGSALRIVRRQSAWPLWGVAAAVLAWWLFRARHSAESAARTR